MAIFYAGNQEFVTVNISQDDRIRLIYVPDDVATKVEQTVRFNWTKGIHEIKDSRPELLELKLGGIPWASPEGMIVCCFLIMP